MLRDRVRARGFEPSDSALLEADVMRFMAILAFCLMVIFALIKAIPAGRSDPKVEIANLEMVEARYRAAQERLGAALALARRLTEIIEQRRLAAEHADVTARLRAARATLQERNEELQLLGRALQARQRELSDVEQQIRRVRRTVDRETSNLQRIRDQLTQSDAAQAGQSAAEPSAADTEATRREGFTLRFASTDAILKLVREGRVGLFAEVGQGLWRAEPAGGFQPSGPPERPYELTDSPGSHLVAAFRRSTGVLSAKETRWLVTFDRDLLGTIGRRMQGRPGGDLVIHGDGRVSRE